ncbi:hypothetical protein Lesp02_12240 [Lentzea sp. NBRC 105346]|uniref:WD40 repeat domain-containing protein n=1 Tax=Lentzea sp. NBRC 105346 TaxID=3032205 RepID=UPI0024A36420|nr:hypothetical protein [Lentzea sp. NBRC 105346]GLZ29034.1 hypothetical protein Lesp02_12240 [Lentzea sp. NBRC 105346]
MPRAERPLDSDGSSLTDFAGDLRKLREQAGAPTYRELAGRAHFSASSLAEAAGGRKLPTLDVTLAYVGACGGDTTSWERRWKELSEELSGNGVASEHPPYAGLSAFGAQDADRFFGRDQLVRQLCELVAARRFTAVIGPSGSGKSSLLQAGLLHARAHGRNGLETGPSVLITPGPRPMRRLTGLDPDALLVVDQFEELFTVCRDAEERARFVAALGEHHVVIGVRADFYAHCAQYPDLVEVLREGQLLVGPMTTDELRSAIIDPATRAGCRVEHALVAKVIEDATGQPGVLPLVSHALLETWRRRKGNLLTLVGYRTAGGITDAIARTAETAYESLSPDRREIARDVFLRLVALGEGTEDTKRRLSLTELDDDASAVLEHLAQARLVTVDRTSVEITHEALIRCWPRMRAWLDEDREGLRRHRELTAATDAWEALDRDPGTLYRGVRLALARELPRLTTREREFVDASVALETAEQTSARRRTKRMRYLVALLAMLLVVSTVATIRAVRSEATVTAQRNSALAQKAAAAAMTLRQTDPALAAELALAAYRLEASDETRDGLLSMVTAPVAGHTDYVNAALFTPDGKRLVTAGKNKTVRIWDLSNRREPRQVALLDIGHNAHSLAMTPDGRRIAVGGGGTLAAQVWDISGTPAKIATVRGHTDVIYSVALSADGGTLATGSWDHTVKLWDVATGQELSTVGGFTLNVKPVAFSPTGHTLAAGSDDRTVRLWDTTDPRHPVELGVLTGHENFVTSAAFSPDGRYLATGSDDHTVRLWDVAARREAAVLRGHEDVVMTVAFSPDGRTLASGAIDRTVRLWDVGKRTPRDVLRWTEGFASVAIGPDGTLATAANDATAQLWDLDVAHAEAVACKGSTHLTQEQWDRHFPGVGFDPPC